MTSEPGVYCIEPGCQRPATQERLSEFCFSHDGTPIVELVCDWHTADPPRPVVCRNWRTPPYRPRWWARPVPTDDA